MPVGDFGGISRVFRSTFPAAEESAFRTNAWREGVAGSPEELRPLYPSILHGLAHAAKADDRTGITLLADRRADGESHRSYRRLYHDARAIGAALRAGGVEPGQRVLLVLPTSFEFIAAFFGTMLAGAVPVPSYPPAVLERAHHAIARLGYVARSAEARVCITNRPLRALLGEVAATSGARTVVVEALAAGDGRQLPRSAPRGTDPAFIQYTSGSTDQPKGVVLDHDNLLANIHAMGQALAIGRGDVVASWLPLYHDMGLIGALLGAVYWRLPLVLMSPTGFLTYPLRWLWMMSDHRASISAAPNFAYALCARRAREADLRGLDLSRWRVALNGAEAVRPETLQGFAATFGPYGLRPETLLPVYGLAEAALAVAFPTPGERAAWEMVDRAGLAAGRAVPSDGPGATAVVSVGRAVPGHAVHVLDEHGQSLPEREVGHVVVQGPSVMRGYAGDARATRAVLDGDVLWTGDLGYRAGGQLYITGRAKDLIIVSGRNYYAEDLERVAAATEGARPGGVVAFGVHDPDRGTERVVLVCETRVKAREARAQLARAVADAVSGATGAPIDEVVLAPPGTVPKTPSGKPQRSRCRTLYVEDQLGRIRTGKLTAARVLLGSATGYLTAGARRLLGRGG